MVRYKATETAFASEVTTIEVCAPHVHAADTAKKHDAVPGTCKTVGTLEYYECTDSECHAKVDASGNELDSIVGSLDSSNHEGTATTWTKTSASHVEIYDCCGAIKTAKAAHSGGTATCNTKAICDVCKAEYGSFADHDYGYSVTGNVLSVACKNSGCNDSLSLNLSARGGSYSGSPVTPTIIFGDYGQQNAWTSAGLTVPSVGNENVKVMYFETANGSKSGTGSETAPINVGSYIASVAYQYGEASTNKVTVDVPFTVNKAHGVGSVTVSNWAYGASASVPVVNSTTNGTTNVNYKYKVKGADDSTYTSTRPTAVGEYTIKAIFAATSNYAEATATSNFAILKAGATTEMSSASAKLNLKAGSTKVISFTDLPEGASIGTPTGVISGVSAVIENNALKLTVGETDLAAETTPFYVEIHIGESTNYMQYDIIVEVTPTLHNHSYSYSTTGAKIIAKSTCHAESECEYENTEKTVELSLATANATYSGSPVSASLEGTSAWTTAGLTAPKINYEGTGSTSYTKSVTAPTNAGSYKATITAGGKTAEKTFSINKKEIAAEDVSLSPSTFVYDGAEKTVTVNVSSDLTKDVDYTVTGTTKATALSTGDGYAVTVTGKGNYTGSVTKYWTITKEPIAITTAPTASGITYGQKLSDSTLTGGNPDSTAGTWTWVNPSTQPSVSDSGVTEYDVKFTPNDTNYGPNTAKVTLTVEKSTPAAPNAVGVAPTAADATDGKVVGVDTTMEYAVYDESSSSYGAYQNVSGTAITDFAAGTKIKVRVKASDNTNTGADKEITIPSYTPPAPPAPPAPHTHIYATTLSSDDTYHWYAATCGHETVKDKETHKWDAGKVTKEVTDTVKGEKTFTCTVCKKTKVEEYSITEDKPAPEEYTIPVKSEDSIQVSASISEGTADVAEITEKDIEKVVGKDDKTANDTVTIDLSGAKQEVTGVTLSKTTVNVLAKATADTKNPVDFVEVKMTNATLQLDSKALTAIGDQAKGKEIKLVVDDTKQENLKKEQKASLSKYTVATTFEAYVECDNTRIHDFKGGNVVVNIAFTPEKGKDIKHYHVYYVADDGTMTHYSTRLKNGILQFTTTHFSDYAVIYDEKNENDTDKTPEDSEDKTPDEPGDEPGDVKPDNPSDEPGDEPTTEQNPTTEQAPTVITPAKMEKNTLSINSRLKVSQTKKQINVTWGKVSGATGYKVYASYCGSKFAKPVKTTKSTSCTIKKLNGKALNLTKNFKVRVVAYKKVNGKEVTLGKTITAHVVGKNNKKYTNAKSIKLAKRSFTLKKGKTAKIVASTVLVDSKKHQLTDAHAKEFRYASSNKAIATVSKTGVIKAKKKGTCTVYVYARNGYAKTIKVIVK
ncbi:MAG: Ig-like domain-containing protein [Oscillospiraceae bacterium]|nr:Ig-like domain-containing protein [Oscillospiraceae bacterium]